MPIVDVFSAEEMAGNLAANAGSIAGFCADGIESPARLAGLRGGVKNEPHGTAGKSCGEQERTPGAHMSASGTRPIYTDFGYLQHNSV